MTVTREEGLPVFAKLEKPGFYRLNVWVQPGAKADAVSGIYRECLKIALRAPAVDNKANKALLGFLAELFQTAGRKIEIVSGHGARRKTLRLASEGVPVWPLGSGAGTQIITK